MLECLFNRAWQTYAHSMLCIYDAKNTILLLYERTKEVGVYISCYGVIPGRDQESSPWVCTMLSRALCRHLDKIPGPSQGWRIVGIVQHLVGVYFFRQKNIRTKDSFKGQMYIQAGLLFICPLNVCTCGDCLRLFCLEKNKSGWHY